MFTPDNFYSVLCERFSSDGENVLYNAPIHGTKSLLKFLAHISIPDVEHKFNNSGLSYRMQIPSIWLYDQEPFFDDTTYQFRQIFLDSTDPDIHYVVEKISNIQKFALTYPNASFPLMCTSDKTGRILDELSSNHFIVCYYWYHAFIARDWYRHYQYNISLDLNNKHENRHRFMMYCRSTDGTRFYRNTVKNLLQPYKNQIMYDWESNKFIFPDASASISIDDAKSADIQLVLETLFDTDKCYLTEKVFKPMVMNQAFIIWGPPKTLSLLRDYGFQTFHGIWSEEYDQETDHDKRMAMLSDLVKKLAAMDSKEYQILYKKCLPIIEHNRSWFYSERFMEHCWKELIDNFSEAFARQKEMSAMYPGGQFFKLLNEMPEILLLPARKAIAKQYLQVVGQTQQKNIINKYQWVSEL